MIALSILICSLESRREMRKAMLFGLVASIGECENEIIEYENCEVEKFTSKDVEIIICTDNKQMSVGEKRNLLVRQSIGKYLSCIDDDDKIESIYKRELIEAINISLADVITFVVSVSLDSAPPKLCFYSKDYVKDYNDSNSYYRLPNHLMCVKRKLAIQVPFKEVNFGEDTDYAERLKPLLQSEYNIVKVLYHYVFNSKTTETQRK